MSKVSLHPICIKNQDENNNILVLDTSELRFRSVQNLYLELETLPLTEPFRMHTFNCFWHKGTEYVLLDQLETDYTDKLYFCMKRPQWSVYIGNVVAISYAVCTVCVHHVSRVVFMYQVLDGGFFRTVKDEFRKVNYTETTSVSAISHPLPQYASSQLMVCVLV